MTRGNDRQLGEVGISSLSVCDDVNLRIRCRPIDTYWPIDQSRFCPHVVTARHSVIRHIITKACKRATRPSLSDCANTAGWTLTSWMRNVVNVARIACRRSMSRQLQQQQLCTMQYNTVSKLSPCILVEFFLPKYLPQSTIACFCSNNSGDNKATL